MRLVTHLQSNQRQTSCKGFYTQGKHWEIVTVKGVEKGGEFAVFYESDGQLWKQVLNQEHYGVDKYWRKKIKTRPPQPTQILFR
jgi:hypothetical protein